MHPYRSTHVGGEGLGGGSASVAAELEPVRCQTWLEDNPRQLGPVFSLTRIEGERKAKASVTAELDPARARADAFCLTRSGGEGETTASIAADELDFGCLRFSVRVTPARPSRPDVILVCFA